MTIGVGGLADVALRTRSESMQKALLAHAAAKRGHLAAMTNSTRRWQAVLIAAFGVGTTRGKVVYK